MRQIEEIDILFLWRIIKKHYRVILLGGTVFAAGTFLVCRFWIKPTYKAEISLFAWGDSQPQANIPGVSTGMNHRPEALTISDINFGTQLVNDYKELLASRYVREKVDGILAERLPGERDIPYTFEAALLKQTRFVKASVYCKSAVKAEMAAQVTAEAFIDAVNELMSIRRVQIVDKAKVIGPVSPRTGLNTLIAFCLGAGGVFGFFFLRDFFHHTLRDSEIVSAELGLPTIGLIGEVSGGEQAKLACLPRESKQYKFNHVMEDFLLLQTNLQYSLPQKSGAQVLAFTSALPQDGKTFTCANLALTLAGGGKRILLVNCDLRKVEFDYFDIPRQPGLVNFLLGEKKIEEVIHRNVLGTALSVITSGPIPPNPARMLEIFRDCGILEKLARDYDYIILDAPPFLNMADPLLLSRLADGTVIVADSRRTPVEAVRQAVEQLRKLGGNMLGVVLNFYASGAAGYGYGYGTSESGKEE